MATVNLAPNTEYLLVARRRQRSIFTIVAIVAVILLVVWFIIFSLQSSLDNQIEDSRGRLRAIESEIARLASIAERIELFEGRLVGLDQLLASHINWDPLLKEIERLLPPTATLTHLTTQTTDGGLEMVGFINNLDQLSQALASLENEPQHSSLFSSARLTSVTREPVVDSVSSDQIGERYQFTVQFKYNPEVLRGL